MSEEKYELTMFDLEENKQYEALQSDLKWPVYRKGGGIYHTDDSPFQLMDGGADRFREIKPRKKLYAYLKEVNYRGAWELVWFEDEHPNWTRLPEFDREIDCN